ncbi:MAG: hypothetical protein D4R80_06585 [Deltaproteobacteria bacterium]|nr:MAG: hypothetical protein D4R80_06585 [Deltaproteobacteria bacterium]
MVGELEDYDCEKCGDDAKAARGCTADALVPVFQIGGEDLKRCPLRFLSPLMLQVARTHKYTAEGILPVAGGWLDQSGTLIEALDILTGEIAQHGKQ